eukprot:1200329-Amphidinium_carterae.1
MRRALTAITTAALGAASRPSRAPTEVRWKHRSGLQSFVWHAFPSWTTKKGSALALQGLPIRQEKRDPDADSASEQLLA